MNQSSPPTVTVLVAAWNAASAVGPHIESFLRLRYPHRELILCAGGEDETLQSAQQYQSESVVIVPQIAGEGKQRALQRAFPQAQGQVIYLTDVDCLLDNNSFEQIVRPILNGEEQVCTGISIPCQDTLHHPFVVLQAVNQLAGIEQAAYTSGIFGRNCAISRSLLQRTSGLDAPAPTGTDYVLGKVLQQHGARFRYLPTSRIETAYPNCATDYVRQQRRWLRNIIWHGWRFGAFDEVRHALITAFIGLMMLLLPPASLFLPPLIALWAALFLYALRSRRRYLQAGGQQLNLPVHRQHYALLPLHLLLDFFCWAIVPFDCLSATQRAKW